MTWRPIRTLEDVESIRDEIEEFAAEGWAVDIETGRVDWEEWADRFERRYQVELPGDFFDPAMKRVQRIARRVIRESR